MTDETPTIWKRAKKMRAGAAITNIFTTCVLDVFFLYLHNKFVNIIKGVNKKWTLREIGGVSFIC